MSEACVAAGCRLGIGAPGAAGLLLAHAIGLRAADSASAPQPGRDTHSDLSRDGTPTPTYGRAISMGVL